jgi:hypothetical protein
MKVLTELQRVFAPEVWGRFGGLVLALHYVVQTTKNYMKLIKKLKWPLKFKHLRKKKRLRLEWRY